MAEAAGAWHNADEFARAALGGLGTGRRTLAFVFDPELLLPWPEDGSAEVVDSAGDPWRILSYRGNDMALRARLEPGRRTAIWVRPAPGEPAATIDVTTLADLLDLADAFLDASPAGMLSTLLPGIPLPPDIAEWAPRAVKEPLPFARALGRVAQQHHGAVGKRHVLAAAVSATGRQVPPALAWLNDGSPGRLVASYLHLLAVDASLPVRTAAAEQFRHVASLLPGIAAGRGATAILQAPSEAMLDLVYALAAARRHGLPDALAAIINHGLATDVAWLLADQGEARAALLEAADCLNDDPDSQRAIAQAVERRLTPTRLRQLQALLAPAAQNWPAERIAGVRLALLMQVIEDGLSPDLEAAPLDVEEPVGATRLVRAAEALLRIGRFLARLAVIPAADPAQLALDHLVDLYVAHLATLEYDTAEARRDLRSMAAVLGDQPKLAARLSELSAAVATRLDTANRRFASLLQADTGALARSPRSLHRWLPSDVIPRSQADRGKRLWLLVFDGLRWDLWERVLRPKLESLGWTAAGRAGLACLPSETAFCRRSLLGGKLPPSWLTDAFPSEEALLRACLANRDAGKSLVYRLKAELGEDAGPAPDIGTVNAWVYRTPDRLAHHADGSLADVAFQFDAFLEQNVLPELGELIGADDLVFLGTDHGFLSASAQEVVTLSAPAELVHDRYVEVRGGDDAPAGVDVRYGERRYRVAVGDTLFRPLTAHSPTPGFRHGGATLQELVIPLVELRLPSRSSGALRLTLSGPSTLEEDAAAEFIARISNGAEEAVRGQLQFDTNLGREMALPLQLQPGAEQERRRSVVGRENMEWVRVRLVAGNAVLAAATQRVQVTLKAGIRFTGADKLDEW